MKEITLDANAKINLYLDVVSKRSDGYHNIESVMQTLSLSDKVSVRWNECINKKSIKQTFINSDLPCDETNLCYKAAKAYFNCFDIDSYDIEISVEKNIPEAAGLAGGSADAAAVIRALDILCKKNSADTVLSEIGLMVGSDVAFCIVGGTCKVCGRGEIVEKLSPIPKLWAVVSKSQNESVSTKEAYAKIDSREINSDEKISFNDYIDALSRGDIKALTENVYNVFQNVMADSLCDTYEIINSMKKDGALCSLMSGSGPSVFGLFDNEELAKNACGNLKNKYYAELCMPV